MKIILTIINGILLITVPLMTCIILALVWIFLEGNGEYIDVDMTYRFAWIFPLVIILKLIKYQLKVEE